MSAVREAQGRKAAASRNATPGSAQHVKEGIMNEKNAEQPEAPENTTDMDRREFLATAAAVGGAMVLGFWLPPRAEAASVPVAAQPWYREAAVPEINAWITIAPDDTVTIRVGQTELGTGTLT